MKPRPEADDSIFPRRREAASRLSAGYVPSGRGAAFLSANCLFFLGIWVQSSHRAFAFEVVNKLKARGVNDILIAVVDGLKGFPEAITSVSAHRRADLHRAPDPQQPGVRVLERPPVNPAGNQGDLPGRGCRDGARPARRVRG